MKCNIINQTNDNTYKEYYPLIRSYFRKTLKMLKKGKDNEISLILVDEVAIRDINRDYRGIDRETDVISFAEIDGEADLIEEEVNYLGDIFINLKRVKSQALDYEHSEKREFCFLFVHGLLHCLGYDHMNEEDEKVMISLQKEIIGDLR